MTALFGIAQSTTYNEKYVVTTNGTAAAEKAGVEVVTNNGDGTINFTLQDFYISAFGSEISVGDLNIQNAEVETGTDGLLYFTKEGTFTVPAEKLSGMYSMFASNLANMPVKLSGKLNGEKLFALLDIESNGKIMGMTLQINVRIGTDDFPVVPVGAKVYTEQLLVTINGETSEPQMTDVTVVSNGDGTINFELKNFILGAGSESMPVGNIVVENIPVTEGSDGLKYFTYDDALTIQPGDLSGIEMWYGPMLGAIPLKLQGKMNENKLYVTIDIDLQSSLGQIVSVQLGTDDFIIVPAGGKLYSEPLVVTINGESSAPQMADVIVIDNGDGTINFELKNFVLGAGSESMPVGNIVVENIAVTEGSDGLKYFTYDDALTIQPGDKAGVEMWYGPMLGAIPLKLQGKMNDENLYVTIDIDLQSSLGQIVNVQVGTDDFVPAPVKSTVYTEQLLVTINGETSEPQTTDVTVEENEDGTINLLLKNFFLASGSESIPVGNIYVQNLTLKEGEDGLQHFSYDASLAIQPGDLAGVEMWYGTALGDIPLKLNGVMNNKKLYVTIDIDMQSTLGQMVYVQLGTEFVIRNYAEPYFVTFRTLTTGPSTARTAQIVLTENGDGTINFTLKDFVVAAGEIEIPLGDLTLHYLQTEEPKLGKTPFSGVRNIDIPVDKLPTDNQMVQMAVMAGVFNDPLPVTISGWYDDENLYTELNAEAQKMGIDLSFEVQIGYAIGDLNRDTKVDIADAVTVLNVMANGEYKLEADLNYDGKIDIADFVTVLNIMAAE